MERLGNAEDHVIRPLNDKEKAVLQPEIEAYANGLAALGRLQRMVALLVDDHEGVRLDLDRMALVRDDGRT